MKKWIVVLMTALLAMSFSGCFSLFMKVKTEKPSLEPMRTTVEPVEKKEEVVEATVVLEED